jgi:hypothetical protein
MLEPLIGSTTREHVLVFILTRGEAYARAIAQFHGRNLYAYQMQLEKLEDGGVIVSRTAGRTRLYSFNPRYPFLTQLTALLERVVAFYPVEEREKLLMNRRRPRRRGKPL